jgi:2-dehydropantoate 2-reductase
MRSGAESEQAMRVTVIGPGAVGLLWASRLHQAGAQVAILDHRPERPQRLNDQGILLEDDGGQARLDLKTGADPQILAETDLALVCVKAYQTGEAAQVLGEHLNAQGRALTLQNGAGNVETLVEALGPQRVLGGITSEGATLLKEGHVRHAGKGQTHLGPAQGPLDGFSQEVAELLNNAGFATQAVEGCQNLIWTKLVINVGINPLTAILNVPNGRLLELDHAALMMERVVDEAVAVGEKLGINFIHEDMLEAVREVARRTAKNISSMLQDVRAGRRTEVQFINGAVLDKGVELGLTCPFNASLASLVLALEENY